MTKLTNTQLLMYLDGEADAELEGKIRESEGLQKRVQELAHLQNQLKIPLYRYRCPKAQELVEYQLGLLPGDRAEVIVNHLSGCPHCSREFAELHVFMDRETPLATFKKLVVQLVSGITDIGQTRLTPAYEVRGSADKLLIYEAEGIRISVDIQDDVDASGHKVLVGLITGMNAEDYSVQLWSAKNQIAETQIDDLGNFLISGIYPGEFELMIKGPEVEVQIQKLQI